MIQFLMNEAGEKQAVMVPFTEFDASQAKLRKIGILKDGRAAYLWSLGVEKEGGVGQTRKEVVRI